jgi:hypothetical protein
MVDYRAAIASFPSDALLRKAFWPRKRVPRILLEEIRQYAQMAIFAPLAESDLTERLYLVRNGALIWRAFTNSEGKKVRYTFTEGAHSDSERQLIAELRVVAGVSLEIEGVGNIIVDGEDIVFVPEAQEAPQEVVRGEKAEILLFDPYRKLTRRWL